MKSCWIICAGVLLLAVTALAAPSPRPVDGGNAPIEISADRLEADDIAKTLVFIGNALAKQGDVIIQGDRLTIFYAGKEQGGDVDRIVAEGNVRIAQGQRLATGGKAEYFRTDERVILTGSPQVREGQNSVQGHEITLFLKENRSVVKGGQNSRVNAVFQPGGGEAR